MSCIVRQCRSHSGRSGPNISFHKFPKNEDTGRQWFIATDRSEKLHKPYWRVCSRHFNPECFVRGMLLRVRLKDNAVPTLDLHIKGKVTLINQHQNNFGTSSSDLALPLVTPVLICPSANVSQHQKSPSSSILAMALKTPEICPSANVSQHQKSSTSSILAMALKTPKICPSANVSQHQRRTSSSVSTTPLETTGLDIARTTSDNLSTVKAMYEGRIDKLQKQIAKLELIAKNRLLKLNAAKQRTRRLKKMNSTLNERLIELLRNEYINN